MQLGVAGCAVSLEASSAAELHDLRAALGSGVEVEVEGPPQLILRCERGSVPMPKTKPDRVVQNMRFWDEDDDVIVAPGPGLTARVSRERALLDPGDGGVRGIHGLLLPVLSLLFDQQDACLTHGAAFLSGDAAVLALGASGQGKSTLVTAALSLGLPVLCDDMVVLRLRADGICVSGVPIPLALPADLAHHPAVGHAIAGDHRQRRQPAQPAALAPGEYPVSTVVLVEHSEVDAGHLTPADGRAVLGALLTSTLDGMSAGRARRVFPFAAAASRAGAWRLGHAADPARRLHAAAVWLEELRCERAPGGSVR